MNEKEKSRVQREAIQNALMKEQWDLFITLHWRQKEYPIERAHRKLYALDAWVATAMVGKRAHKPSNFCKRIKWFGTLGRNAQKHLHAHLLVQLPLGADKGSVVALIDAHHKTLQGNDAYSLDITDDKEARVNYILKQEHLPFESYFSDKINFNHIVSSHNYEMPTT